MVYKNERYKNLTYDGKARAILDLEIDRIFKEENRKKNELRQREKYGTDYKIREQGKKDRLVGLYFIKDDRYDTSNIVNDGELTSYVNGYTEFANRELLVGICSSKYDSESLYRIGYNDAMDEVIVFDELPIHVKENKDYLDGYEAGLLDRKKNSKYR